MTALRNARRRGVALAALAVAVAAGAHGQEATNTPAATQPSVGKWYLREKVQYLQLRDDPTGAGREVDKVQSTTSLALGLTRELSASLTLPLVFADETRRDEGSDDDLGLDDASLAVKWRPFQRDLSPVDSVRLALFGGVELPTGTGDFGSDSVDPFVGAVATAILGRHGINQALTWRFNAGDRDDTRAGDGPDDALRYDTAYLYRLSPETYSADTAAATYLTVELNGLYETNGDNEILLGPGLLYEARTFALEATVGLPIVQELDERLETELVVTLGFRVLF